MFINFGNTNQPYFIVNSSIFDSSQPFINFNQCFFNSYANGFNHFLMPQNSNPLALDRIPTTQSLIPRSNQEVNTIRSLQQPKALQKKSKQSKEIKKQANRPATYLTEKKYYLSLTLQDDKDQGRVLRKRNLKKKKNKTIEAQKRENDKNQMLKEVMKVQIKQKEELQESDNELEVQGKQGGQLIEQPLLKGLNEIDSLNQIEQ